MPGALGASARSAPTFLVPDAAGVPPVVGAVWAWLAIVPLKQIARKKCIFIVVASANNGEQHYAAICGGLVSARLGSACGYLRLLVLVA
jgi:hypothetical protein